MPSHDRGTASFVDNFSKSERECAYWVLLALSIVSYLIITRQSFFNLFEDCGIVVARALQSVYGLGCLLFLCIAMCRRAKKGRRAMWYFYGLFLFVFVIYLLDYFVFPEDLIPVEITDEWTLFNETTGYTKNWTANGSVTGNATAKQAHRDAFQKYGAEGEQDLDDVAGWFGLGFYPVLMIAGFGFALYSFRVVSAKAIVATAIVVAIGSLLALQAFISRQELAAALGLNVTNSTNTTNASHAALWTEAAAKPNFLPATWVERTDSFQILSGSSKWAGTPMRPEQTAGAGTGRIRLGALERLRGVEAQLDELLLRADTTAANGHAN